MAAISTQVVSPLFTVAAASAGVAVRKVVSARPAGKPTRSWRNFGGIVISLSFFDLLESRRAGFAGADAHGGLKWQDENFAITDLAGLARRLDCFHNPVSHGLFDGNFDFDFGDEAHGIFSAA